MAVLNNQRVFYPLENQLQVTCMGRSNKALMVEGISCF